VAHLLTLYSRLLQVVLPLLQGHQGVAVQVRRKVLRPRARPDRYVALPVVPAHWNPTTNTIVCADDGADIQNALAEMTSQRSVPNIFIKGEHIGGNSDIQALKKDDLKSKLTAASAL
jgi:glutaredoxin